MTPRTSSVEISVILCTRNRAAQLGQALASLSVLACSAPWELVLVDNGSTDNTQEVLSDFVSRCPMPATLMYEGRSGLARARNCGLRAASGRIVAFTDDDCYPAANWLDAHLECFSDRRLGFVGGRILLFDPTDLPVSIQELNEPIVYRPASYIRPGIIHGANFAFLRAALEQAGGFDERFGAGAPLMSAEDTDALARVSAAGWWGVYDPRPLVYHHHGRKASADLHKLERGYGIGAGAYFAKCLAHPRLTLKYLARWGWLTLHQPWIWTRWQLEGAWRWYRGESSSGL